MGIFDSVKSRSVRCWNLARIRLCIELKLSVDPSTGERWALVEEPPHGVAHAMTTLYGAARLRENGASFNTQLLALGAVAITLNWAVQKKIDLEQRIGACQFFDRGETLDLRRRLRHNFNVEKARSDKARKLVRETVGKRPTAIACATSVPTWFGTPRTSFAASRPTRLRKCRRRGTVSTTFAQ